MKRGRGKDSHRCTRRSPSRSYMRHGCSRLGRWLGRRASRGTLLWGIGVSRVGYYGREGGGGTDAVENVRLAGWEEVLDVAEGVAVICL